MDKIDINHFNYLNRQDIIIKMKEILTNFDLNKNNPLFKKGIYIYGEPGTGKTNFVLQVLKEMNYDAICYDAGDIRNKSIIDTITHHNMSDKNIMSMFHKNIKKIAIVMDEIDGMNNGDKGGINTLIKLIRPKKTKKQKNEDNSVNPIICIGNNYFDKKIKELMKVCNVIELKTPTRIQIHNITNFLMPSIEKELMQNILDFILFDLRKINIIYEIYNNNKSILNINTIQNILQVKSSNIDTKQIVHKLYNNVYNIEEHNTIMNETDRTIVGLLWHENIIDTFSKMKKNISIPIYIKILNNICFADYIDRITFQKQIWIFNEMTSLIKIFQNNKIFHDSIKKKFKSNYLDIRFTKVLTKYSTEYNNLLFIQNLCQQLGMDKKDLFAFFLDFKNKYDDNNITFFENYEITKLDINRIFRYLEKYTNENAEQIEDFDFIIEEEKMLE